MNRISGLTKWALCFTAVIAWRLSGIPEDFDYPDITGTSQRGGYYDYAMQQYHKHRNHIALHYYRTTISIGHDLSQIH